MFLWSGHGNIWTTNRSKKSPEEIAKFVDADDVRYQSLSGYIKATDFNRNQLCLGCVTCKYPTLLAQRIADKMKKRFLEGHEEAGRLYELIEAT